MIGHASLHELRHCARLLGEAIASDDFVPRLAGAPT
jgi:hypothetical protein